MVSVVVPAFNEEAGIQVLLDSLVRSPEFGADIEVVVVPNGCTDRTADVARSYGVHVVEIEQGSKIAALNAGDAAAKGFPRVYLDADIAVTPAIIRALAAAVSSDGILGATPKPAVDTSGSSAPVRAFYAVNSRLPALRGRLFGRGVIALAEEARSRFGEFPDIIADDMLLDAIVAGSEKREIDATVRVIAPATLGELIRRVSRSKAGNDEFWQWVKDHPEVRLADPVTGSAAASWFRDVVLPHPRLWLVGLWYPAVVGLVAARRRMPGWSARAGWGRTPTRRRGTR